MIPATYPSILDSSNRTKMLVYQVPSITGLTRWVDYIPVKSPTSESDLTLANTFANSGFILTSKVNDITGLVPFKDYVPIYLDSTATKAWSADNDGYIPMAELAGLLLDFTTGTLDERIKFTRTTNATVTNSAGLITYAPHNLLTYSEQFDNAAWSKTNLTVTANSIVAPDNTTTADKIEVTTTAATLGSRAIASIQATSLTYSIYVKKGNVATQANSFAIYNSTTATEVGRCTINYDTGVVTNVIGTAAYSVDAGNGWWRVVLPVTSGINIGNNIILYYGFLGTSITAGTFFYAWGAQLEIGSTATTYNPTTVKNLLGYSESFDNAAWIKSNSFVQTNLLTYSEAFDNAAWLKTVVSTTANTTIAPNGYQTADTFSVNDTSIIYQTITCTASTAYTFSFYVQLGTLAASDFKFAIRNDTAGTFIAQDIVPTQTPIASGWTRITYTFTTPVGCVLVRPYIFRNGTTAAGTFFVWGAQLVQGSVAGDYRRTDAAALPVYYPNHNGVVCAEKLVENTANSTHQLSVSTTTGLANGTYVASIYAKAAERTKVRLINSDNATGGATAIFDLSAGTVTYEGISGNYSAGSAGIESVGNGVYRCYVSATKNGSGNTNNTFIAQLYTTTATYTGDGTSGIYIFGAQLSDSASLDPYVLNAAAAPTAAAYYGARFDYDPVTLAPKGLLIEEQRANLFTYSEDYTQTAWVKARATISANVITAPDGTLTADALYETVDTGTHLLLQNGTTAGQAFTVSFYVKGGLGRNWVWLRNITNAGGGAPGVGSAYFDITNGVVGTVSAGVTATITPLSNGWYKCSSTTANTATSTQGWGIGIASADNVDSYAGDITKGIYVWGAQFEAGAFATSYIPTAASQVTRAADVATIQGSNFYSWYNQNEGSVKTIAYVHKADPSTAQYPYAFTENATNNTIFTAVSANAISFNITTGGAAQAAISTSSVLANTLFNVCSGYKLNDSASVLNNGTVGTDTSVITPLVDRFILGNRSDFARNLNGHIKLISYYPQRLSNDVLKGLTA